MFSGSRHPQQIVMILIVAGVRGCGEGRIQMRGSMIERLVCVLTCCEAVLYGAKYQPIRMSSSPFRSTETEPATVISTVQIIRDAFLRCCRQVAVHVVTSRSPPTDIDVVCRSCRKDASKVGSSFSADMRVPASKALRVCGLRNWPECLADTETRTTQGSF